MSGDVARRVPAVPKARAQRQQRPTVAVAEKPRTNDLEAILRELEQYAMQAVRDQLDHKRPVGSGTSLPGQASPESKNRRTR